MIPIISEFLSSFENLKCYTLNVKPNSKPRMTANDNFRRPQHKKYWIFKEDIQWQAVKAKLDDLPGMISFIVFYVPIPKMSKKNTELLENVPVPKVPDIDNYMKAFQDCLAKQDNYIHTVGMAKRYSSNPRIELYVNEEMNKEMDAKNKQIYETTKLYK